MSLEESPATSNKAEFVECDETCVPCSCDKRDDSYVEWNVVGKKYSFRRLEFITRWGLIYGTLNSSRLLGGKHRPDLITPEMEKIEYFRQALYGLTDENVVKENIAKAKAYEKTAMKEEAAKQLNFAQAAWEMGVAEGYVTGDFVPPTIDFDAMCEPEEDPMSSTTHQDDNSPLMVNKMSDQELIPEIHKAMDIIVDFLNSPLGRYIKNKVTVKNSNYKIVYHLCNFFNVCIEESIDQIIQLQNGSSQSLENTESFFEFSVESNQYRLIACALYRGTPNMYKSLIIQPHNLQQVQLIKYLYEEIWYVKEKFDKEFGDILRKYGTKYISQTYPDYIEERKELKFRLLDGATPEMKLRIDDIEQIISYAFTNEICNIINGVISMNSEHHLMILASPGTRIYHGSPKKIKSITFYTAVQAPCLLQMEIEFYDIPETHRIGELPKITGEKNDLYTSSTFSFAVDEQIRQIDVGFKRTVICALKFYTSAADKVYGPMEIADKVVVEKLPSFSKSLGNRWNRGTLDIKDKSLGVIQGAIGTTIHSHIQGFANLYGFLIPHQIKFPDPNNPTKTLTEGYEIQAARACLNGVAGCDIDTDFRGSAQPIKAISSIFFEWRHTLHVPKLYDPTSNDPEIVARTNLIDRYKQMEYEF